MPRAIKYGMKALDDSGIGKSDRDRAWCYLIIGRAMAKTGKYDNALSNLIKALIIFKEMPGTEPEQGACNQSIGRTFQLMGKYPQAADAFKKAIVNLKSVQGSDQEVAGCYVNLGFILGESGLLEEAIAYQEQALAILSKIAGTERDQAACFANIGTALASMGEFGQAKQWFEQSLTIVKKYPDTWQEQARCYANIGTVLLTNGDYKGADTNYKQAIGLFKRIVGTEQEQAACLLSRALILVEMGETKRAITKCKKVLAIYEPIAGTESDRSDCYYVIGRAHFQAGQLSEAVLAYGQAKHLASNWQVSRDLGNVYRQRGYPGDSKRAFNELIESIHVAELRRLTVTATDYRAAIFEGPSATYPDLVSFLVEQGDQNIEAAFHFADRGKGRSLEEALHEKTLLRASHTDTRVLAEDRRLSWRISKLSSLRELLPDSDERHKKLTMDIYALQNKRNMIEVELKKAALDTYTAPVFRRPMEIAQNLDSDIAVLQYSIGNKGGYLLILTREGVTAHKITACTQALLELFPRQEASLDQLLEAWNNRADKIGLDGMVRLARARGEDLARKKEEQHNLIDAEKEKAILEHLGRIVLPESALKELRTKNIRGLLIIPDRSLHYIPFSMLRLKKEGGTGKRYLVEEFSSSYIPSMMTLDTIRKQQHEREGKCLTVNRSLLAFANPAYDAENVAFVPSFIFADDGMLTRALAFRKNYYKDSGLCLNRLPETEQEAIIVASLFAPPKIFRAILKEDPAGQAIVFTDRGASEKQVKQLFAMSSDSKPRNRWQYVLFSTHSLADMRNGMLSCLALSTTTTDSEEDGFLQAQEVMNLEIDADLVVLSACQTGLGRLRAGEGFVGLSTAFFYAGSESVCASLWQVPSGPTKQLMSDLFRRLKEGKVGRAVALQKAQLRLLLDGKNSEGKPVDYSAPFCWSAFVLMGEYR